MTEATTKEAKKAVMKDIILKLHQGFTPEQAREQFEREVGDVSSTDIAEMEQSLINEGLSPDEIKKFCNVHALLFQSALEKAAVSETSTSHPVYLFRQENREVQKLVAVIKETMAKRSSMDIGSLRDAVRQHLEQLKGVERHYERKEQLLFPFLEKYGFMGPSKVMWGKDNDIRELFRKALSALPGVDSAAAFDSYAGATLNPLLEEVLGMVFKEENILFPTSMEKLKPADWVEILKESDQVGYVFIQKPAETEEMMRHLRSALICETTYADGSVALPSGSIRLEELAPLLNMLPVDITFVDKEDRVQYFSQGKDRIFLRTRSVIGRRVQNCHPPQSVDTVERILASFKAGKRDHYDFWINFNSRLVYIRYLAVRDTEGAYLGTLEVTQDITDVKKLEGERRLLDERA